MLSRPQVVLMVLAVLAFVAVFAVSAPLVKTALVLVGVCAGYLAFQGKMG